MATFEPDTAERCDSPVAMYACCSDAPCIEVSPSTMPGMRPCECSPTCSRTASANVARTCCAHPDAPVGPANGSTVPLTAHGLTPTRDDSDTVPSTRTVAPLTTPSGTPPRTNTGSSAPPLPARTPTSIPPESSSFGAAVTVASTGRRSVPARATAMRTQATTTVATPPEPTSTAWPTARAHPHSTTTAATTANPAHGARATVTIVAIQTHSAVGTSRSSCTAYSPTSGAIASNFAGPIPLTCIRSSTFWNGPFASLCAIIAAAVASPTPGSVTSSAADAPLSEI